MPLKDLLLMIGTDTEAGERYALELARLSGATVTVTSSGAAPSLPAFIRAEMPGDLLDHMREDVENTARAALEAFSDRAKQVGVTVETMMLDLTRGDITSEVSRLARYFSAGWPGILMPPFCSNLILQAQGQPTLSKRYCSGQDDPC